MGVADIYDIVLGVLRRSGDPLAQPCEVCGRAAYQTPGVLETRGSHDPVHWTFCSQPHEVEPFPD